MKHNVNKALLFLIVIPLFLFAWFSAYYSETSRNVTVEFNKSKADIEEITGKLIVVEHEANKSLDIREKLEKDKEELEKGYMEINEENEVMRKELLSLREELAATKSELNDKTTKFNLLQSRFNQVEDSLIKANDDISRLSARVRNLCEKLEDVGGDDEEC